MKLTNEEKDEITFDLGMVTPYPNLVLAGLGTRSPKGYQCIWFGVWGTYGPSRLGGIIMRPQTPTKQRDYATNYASIIRGPKAQLC